MNLVFRLRSTWNAAVDASLASDDTIVLRGCGIRWPAADVLVSFACAFLTLVPLLMWTPGFGYRMVGSIFFAAALGVLTIFRPWWALTFATLGLVAVAALTPSISWWWEWRSVSIYALLHLLEHANPGHFLHNLVIGGLVLAIASPLRPIRGTDVVVIALAAILGDLTAVSWIGLPGSTHAGASGIVSGLALGMPLLAILRARFASIVLLIPLLLYAVVVHDQMFASRVDSGVSWYGHAGGGIGGLLAVAGLALRTWWIRCRQPLIPDPTIAPTKVMTST